MALFVPCFPGTRELILYLSIGFWFCRNKSRVYKTHLKINDAFSDEVPLWFFLQHNPVHIYLGLRTLSSMGTYSKVSMFRVAALGPNLFLASLQCVALPTESKLQSVVGHMTRWIKRGQ